MTEVNPPMWQEDGSFLAQQDRMAVMALMTPHPAAGAWAPLPGVRPSPSSPLAVTAQTSPNMSVNVNTGTVFVAAAIAQNAGWVCSNNGNTVVNIAAASASNPRIDLIVAHVYDATDDIASSSFWKLEDIQGTPGASPVAPARPANSVVLASVLVGAAATTVTSGGITDARQMTVALGGLLPSSSTGLPGSPYPGQPAWCADTGQVLVYQGTSSPRPSSWQSVAAGPGPWSVTQGTAITWTADSAWRVIPSFGPITFTVPPSGMVFVTITAGLANDSGTASTSVGWKIRDAAVGDTGPNYVAFNGKNAVTASNTTSLHASCRTLVTGLSRGVTLQCLPGNQLTGGSAHDDGAAVLTVEPVP